jgi:hypothetical protein
MPAEAAWARRGEVRSALFMRGFPFCGGGGGFAADEGIDEKPEAEQDQERAEEDGHAQPDGDE